MTRPAPGCPRRSRQSLRADVEANLRALGVDRLTAVNLRRMDADAPGADEVALEDQVAEPGRPA